MGPTGIEQLLATRTDLWRGRGLTRMAAAGLGTGFATLDQALPWGGWPADGLTEILTEHPGSGLGLLLPLLVAASRGARWLLLIDPPWLPYAPALAAHGLDLNRLVLVQAGADGAWAMEQALRSGCCAAVLAWPDGPSGVAAAVARSDPTGLNRTDLNPAVPNPADRTGAAPSASRSAVRRPETACPTTTRPMKTRSAAWSATSLRRLQLAAADGATPGLLLRAPAAAAQPSPAALRLLVSSIADGLDLTLLKLRGGRAGGRVRLGAGMVAGAGWLPVSSVPGSSPGRTTPSRSGPSVQPS